MLENIEFENYKAFKTGKINLKPITILLGANSSGKSSILQLLLLIEQTINNEEYYESALKLNGQFINLGEDENLIKDKNNASKINLSFEFLNQELSKEFKRKSLKLRRDIREIQMLAENFINFTENKKENSSRISPQDFYYNDDIDIITTRVADILRKIKNIDESSFREFWVKSDVRYYFNRRLRNSIADFRNINIQDYKDLIHLYEPLEKLNFKKITIDYCFGFDTQFKKLLIEKFSISINKGTLLGIEKNDEGYCLISDILDNSILNKYKLLRNDVRFSGLELSSLKKSVLPENSILVSNSFLLNILEIFNDSYQLLKQSFNKTKINYIGPLRAFPQRYYFLDEASNKTSLNYYSGTNLAEVLKKNKKVNLLVNDWLKNSLQLNVSVKEFKDIIHNIKIKQNGLDLDITDVGFGISQVLPILVQGFLASEDSITIIEQPEIHLHPKMQANLADLFIAMIQSIDGVEKRLIIETHSEYLLKRLRRRISEGTVDHNKIALYFIHPRNNKNGTARIQKISIDKNGSFEWPEDFYSSEFDDNMAFFKNLAKK